MAALLQSAPQLDMRKTDQIAALPFGAGVKLDPWSNRIALVKTKPVALTSAGKKMPFEVTPFLPLPDPHRPPYVQRKWRKHLEN
jgi:hypothetical protein